MRHHRGVLEAMPHETRDHLGGWKEISSYMARSVRTVQRWEEAFGLPVRRIRTSAGASVLAYRHELDTWRDTPQGRAALAERGGLAAELRTRDSPLGPAPLAAAMGAVPVGPDVRSEAASVGELTRMTARARRPSRAVVWGAGGLTLAGALGLSQGVFRTEASGLLCPGTCELTQGHTLVLSIDGVDPTHSYTRQIRSATGRTESFRPALAPDESGRVTWGFTTDCSSQAGTYELQLLNDVTGQDTNRVSATIRAAPSCVGDVADLVAEGMTLDRVAASPGDRIVCRFALRNQGAVRAGPSIARLRLGRSADRSAVTDRSLGDVPAPAIAVGASTTLSLEVVLPRDLQPGAEYYVWVVADNGSAVLERVSTNNFARSPALLVQPRPSS